MEDKYDIKAIMECIPHRYPFILIDRILEIEPDKRLVALKNVTINEPFFQGHFPEAPIMPGVLMIEAMAQACVVLGFLSSFQDKEDLMFFTGIDKVRFRKPVVPGDQLIMDVKFLKKRTKVVKMSCVATVDEKVVVEAEVMAAKGEKP